MSYDVIVGLLIILIYVLIRSKLVCTILQSYYGNKSSVWPTFLFGNKNTGTYYVLQIIVHIF